ncbi:VOC family protein [Candidatus Nitrospira inopinata]|jgi:hypothetical protein|uniref:Glyoxalase/bleomycin resistance protein/dioxygenase n=1 Tax=Candidatus Nitrospira inopinata TaxID=1715989 RepID=A0A0S4KVP4_9BACT|nr:hypothetical protein [Candidatus Nitrospira inopinata]CUQ67871.1 protein of unknown function [Candidatus Nitrospira inopinata]
MPLSITSLKPYVPSKDFELSKRFYTALGFTPSEGWGGTADFSLNGHTFRLQNYYVQDWANNFMFVIGTWLFRVSNAYLLISLRTVRAPCRSTIQMIGNLPSAAAAH